MNIRIYIARGYWLNASNSANFLYVPTTLLTFPSCHGVLTSECTSSGWSLTSRLIACLTLKSRTT